MFDYIIDSFAGILTKGDVMLLFDELVDHFGNRSKAAEKVGVTPAATYRWTDAKYIKHDTKEKVLKTLLECRYLVALEYLLKRTSDKQTDILRTILMDLYNEAITTDTPDKFREAYRKFEEIRRHFRGTIRDHIEEDVAEMSHSIEERAEELDIPVSLPSIEDFTAKDLVDTLTLIVMEYKSNQGNPTEAAKNLRLPESSIQTFWNTFNSMRTPTPLVRDTESHGLFLGGGLDYLTYLARDSHLALHRPREQERTFFEVVLSPIGAILKTRPSEESMRCFIASIEDASAQFEFQPVSPAGSADSLVLLKEWR